MNIQFSLSTHGSLEYFLISVMVNGFLPVTIFSEKVSAQMLKRILNAPRVYPLLV